MIHNHQNKINRAASQLKSWLRATSIPYESTPGGNRILVTKAGGGVLDVCIVAGEVAEALDGMAITSASLTSSKPSVAIKVFNSITSAAGYGTPTPVNRGDASPRRRLGRDEFELVSMRHCEFRRSPNPDPKHMLQYKNVMECASRLFFGRNSRLMLLNMLEFGDLMSYAMVWTTNYLGLYELQKPDEDNRLLFSHLMQRFNQFKSILIRKGKNCFPSYEEACIATFGLPNGKHTENTDNESEERPPKGASRAELLRRLNAMPHDKMTTALTSVANNTSLHIEAQQAAKKRLKKHYRTCSECQVNEKNGGVNLGGVAK